MYLDKDTMLLLTRMTRNTVSSAFSKRLRIVLGLRIEGTVYRGSLYIIVLEPCQTLRPALVLSSQAAVSSHPELFTPVRVSVKLMNHLKTV